MPPAHWVLNYCGVLDFLRGGQRLTQGPQGNGAGTTHHCSQSSSSILYILIMFIIDLLENVRCKVYLENDCFKGRKQSICLEVYSIVLY